MARKKSQRLMARKIREFQVRQTKKNYNIITKVFKQLAKDVKSNNKAKFANQQMFEIDYKKFTRQIKRALNKVWRTTTDSNTKFINTLYGWRLEKETIAAISKDIINEYNNLYAAEKIKNITDTTRERINKIVENGQKQGLNVNDIAKNIENTILGMSIGRSRTIARTETHNAIERTSNATANEAGMETKTWVHSTAGKVPRQNHLAIDGTEIKLDELFDLGTIKAKYPHDPELPAEEIINCFCICIYS